MVCQSCGAEGELMTFFIVLGICFLMALIAVIIEDWT